MRVTAYLGLGGNLGRPDEAIQQALALLDEHPELSVISTSRFYRTEPVGMAMSEGQAIPWFINAAAEISTSLSASALLQCCLDIEHQLGRDRSQGEPQEGPKSRTLDVDVLFYGDAVIHEPGLTIPHPRLHERAFALYPLRDIAPQLHHPELQQTIEALIHRLPDTDGIQLLEPVESASA